ncbi:MAG TPA: ABC transporter substrate-binding protein [Thermosulfidibacter takaii]|uniref:ABC transporter substrate-binding protein n=1 Tax=Thermosulfidibacter takaii TaxID=412593 RepID=A0A7C0Y8U5_9BACT|nr:ABC transporter substrate-binding protein [Thermosulfidibacter takaii]
MSKVKRGAVKVFIFILGVFLFAFPFTSSHGEEVYEIGAIFAVTGPAAWLGDPEKKAVELMVERLNQQGGIQGKKIKVVIYDTQGDPQIAVLKARELVTKDHVMVILGPSRTPTSAAVMKALQLDREKNRFRIPMVSCAAGRILTQPVKPWVFTTPQTNALAAEKVLEYLSSKGIKRVAVVYVSNEFGEDGYSNLKKLAPKYGIEIVGVETYGGKDRDMTAQLTKLAAKKPKAIINWSVGPTSVIVTKNFKQLGLDKKGILLVMNHGQGNLKYVELCGEAAEGVVLPSGKILVARDLPTTDPQKKVLMNFKEMYEKAYKEPVSHFAGHAYDALMLVVTAIEKGNVKPGDGAALKKALETKTSGFVGIDGIFRYSCQDHNGLSIEDLVMLKVEKGRFTLAR